MSVSNRVGSNNTATKLDLESTIKMKFDEIKADHMYTIYSLDMKISAIIFFKNRLSLMKKHMIILQNGHY